MQAVCVAHHGYIHRRGLEKVPCVDYPSIYSRAQQGLMRLEAGIRMNESAWSIFARVNFIYDYLKMETVSKAQIDGDSCVIASFIGYGCKCGTTYINWV